MTSQTTLPLSRRRGTKTLAAPSVRSRSKAAQRVGQIRRRQTAQVLCLRKSGSPRGTGQFAALGGGAVPVAFRSRGKALSSWAIAIDLLGPRP
jgi:hypothetical protein